MYIFEGLLELLDLFFPFTYITIVMYSSRLGTHSRILDCITVFDTTRMIRPWSINWSTGWGDCRRYDRANHQAYVLCWRRRILPLTNELWLSKSPSINEDVDGMLAGKLFDITQMSRGLYYLC